MANIKKLVKIMLVQWKLMLSGLFTMMIFAVLSGISVTMAVPLFDYVFGSKRISGEIATFPLLFKRIGDILSAAISTSSFSDMFERSFYDGILKEIGNILSITDPVPASDGYFFLHDNFDNYEKSVFLSEQNNFRNSKRKDDRIYKKYAFQKISRSFDEFLQGP
jgi:hypothetical protein